MSEEGKKARRREGELFRGQKPALLSSYPPALKNLLDTKTCFKLICGAGNENLAEVEKLVALYSKAGCHFFDLSANEEVLQAAKRGLDFSIPKDEQENYHFCISIGTNGDQHLQKAIWMARGQEGKRASLSCLKCYKCVEVCPQGAIQKARGQESKSAGIEVIEKYCIGCCKCIKICTQKLISLEFNKNSARLPALLSSGPLACIELHASGIDETEVDEIWNYLNQNFDGVLSLCLGREKLSNEQILNRAKRLVGKREPYTTIIQADGLPMSGGENDFKTTLQAVAMAEIINNAKLPAYLLLSGGTNTKTAELARLCGIDFHGISIGSFARKIVKDYIEREDFFENMAVFNEALKTANNLVEEFKK